MGDDGRAKVQAREPGTGGHHFATATGQAAARAAPTGCGRATSHHGGIVKTKSHDATAAQAKAAVGASARKIFDDYVGKSGKPTSYYLRNGAVYLPGGTLLGPIDNPDVVALVKPLKPNILTHGKLAPWEEQPKPAPAAPPSADAAGVPASLDGYQGAGEVLPVVNGSVFFIQEDEKGKQHYYTRFGHEVRGEQLELVKNDIASGHCKAKALDKGAPIPKPLLDRPTSKEEQAKGFVTLYARDPEGGVDDHGAPLYSSTRVQLTAETVKKFGLTVKDGSVLLAGARIGTYETFKVLVESNLDSVNWVGRRPAGAPPGPPEPPPPPPPSKFERFVAGAKLIGREAAAVNLELGVKILHKAGVLTDAEASRENEADYKMLGVDKDNSSVRAFAVSVKHGLEALPQDAADANWNLGDFVVEGGARTLGAVGIVDKKKAMDWVDEHEAGRVGGQSRANNGWRNAARWLYHGAKKTMTEAELAGAEIQMRRMIASREIDPVLGQQALDDLYKQEGMTQADNTVRKVGAGALHFAIKLDKIDTGTKAGAAILMVRELRASGALPEQDAASWEARIAQYARMDPAEAVAIAHKSRQTAADAFVLAVGVGSELVPDDQRIHALDDLALDVLQKKLDGSKSRVNNDAVETMETLGLPALEMASQALIETGLQRLKVPGPIATAVAAAVVQLAKSAGDHHSVGDTVFEVAVAALENGLASAASAQVLKARMLPKVLQGLSPEMQALYRAGEKKTTEAVNKAVEQGAEILAQQFRNRIASSAVGQATRIPVLLATQLVQHTTIGPDGKPVIDPKWIEEAKHNFPQALVNVAVGEATHQLGKGLPVGKLVGVLVKEEPHPPAGLVKSGHVDAGKGNSPPKAAGAPHAPAPHDDATGTHTPNAKRGDAAAPPPGSVEPGAAKLRSDAGAARQAVRTAEKNYHGAVGTMQAADCAVAAKQKQVTDAAKVGHQTGKLEAELEGLRATAKAERDNWGRASKELAAAREHELALDRKVREAAREKASKEPGAQTGHGSDDQVKAARGREETTTVEREADTKRRLAIVEDDEVSQVRPLAAPAVAAPAAPAPPAPASDPSHSGVRRKPGGGDESTAAALPLAIAAAGGRYHPAGPSVVHGAQPQPQHLPGQQPPPRATADSGDGSKLPSGPRPAASPQEAGHPLAPAGGSPERPVASASPAPPPAAPPGSPPGPPAAHDSPAGPPTLPTGTSPSSTPAMREANARVVELRARETRAREHEAAARDRGMRAKHEAEHYVYVCEAARVAAEKEARAAHRVAKLEAVCNLLSRADPADPVALSKARDELGHAEMIRRKDAAWAKSAAHDLDYDVPESMKAAETHLPAEAPPAWPVEPAPAGPPANDGPAAAPDSNGPPAVRRPPVWLADAAADAAPAPGTPPPVSDDARTPPGAGQPSAPVAGPSGKPGEVAPAPRTLRQGEAPKPVGPIVWDDDDE